MAEYGAGVVHCTETRAFHHRDAFKIQSLAYELHHLPTPGEAAVGDGFGQRPHLDPCKHQPRQPRESV